MEVDVDKPVPEDPYMSARRQQLLQQNKQQSATFALKLGLGSRSIEDDKLKQFLENDGKVLRLVHYMQNYFFFRLSISSLMKCSSTPGADPAYINGRGGL